MINSPFVTSSMGPACRAGRWLASQMDADGSLRNATSIDSYYKAVVGLASAGYQNESERMLDFVIERFLKEDGDLDGNGCTWFEKHRTYPHSWLLMGSVIRARFDVARKLATFIEAYQEPTSGGFYATEEQRRIGGRQEMMATGVAAIALLWAGRVEAAERTGEWFRKLYESQPDISRYLYFVWDSQSGLTTTFPAEQAVEHRVDCGQLAQWYFQFGIAAALAASLYGATGNRQWLELGQAYLLATKHCREDVFRQGTSGKIGWGAAWMYRMTGRAEYRTMAESVYSNLRDTQHADGWWNVANIYSRDWSSSPEPQVSVTGEFAALLSWMENARCCPK